MLKSDKGRPSGPRRTGRKSGGKKPAKGERRRSFRSLYWFAVFIVCGAIGAVAMGFYYAQGLPDISNLKPGVFRPSVTVVADDGSTIANYGDVYGEWLEYKDLPPILVKAVVATEDRRFFEHSGIDIRGLARALFKDILARHIVQGGSTITQQLAKNVFLTSERTIKRKVQEIFLAVWLEEKLTKQQILSAYLNRVFLGARSYGVDAAARTYFGHSARNLSLGEAAMLAGLPKAPSTYSPMRDFEAAMDRTAVVLDKMVEAGYITQPQAAAVKAHPPRVLDREASVDARYFTDWVVNSLPPDFAKLKSSLIVTTTFDVKTQAAAERAITDELTKEGARKHIGEAALVALAPDGAVRAMVGGRSYLKSQYNRAAQARRQVGSAFKLFVYLAALDAGLTPDDVMSDSPVIIDGWQPSNYDGKYMGNVTLREAFADSINTVAVKVAETVDRQRVIAIARKMGITSHIVPHPSMTLGTSQISLLELTEAYAIVGNGGYKTTPYAIVEIRNGQGKILYHRQDPPPQPLIDPKADLVMDSMLQTVVKSGTGRAARLDWEAAGKTGTTQDSRDAWFVGYSKDENGRMLAAGVWMGNDDDSPMKRVTGGGPPARAWHEFMQAAHNGGYIMPRGVRPEMRPTPQTPPSDNIFDRIRRKLFGN